MLLSLVSTESHRTYRAILKKFSDNQTKIKQDLPRSFSAFVGICCLNFVKYLHGLPTEFLHHQNRVDIMNNVIFG